MCKNPLLALVPEIGALGLPEAVITGLCLDSRSLEAGEIFLALRGGNFHGLDYADQALSLGASLILSEDPLPEALAARGLHLADLRARIPALLAHFYQPQPENLVAITGTNGKTSAANFVQQIWQNIGHPAASLGTIGLNVAGKLEPVGGLTSPDIAANHKLLHRMHQRGIAHMALEASSHGLEQGRLAGLKFKAVAFSNLSQDHLDYHENMDHYFAAKRRLFETPLSDGAVFVINRQDPWGERLFQETAKGRSVLDIKEGAGFIQLVKQSQGPGGQALEMMLDGQKYEVYLPLIGDFQAENALIALGLAIACGAAPSAAVEALGKLQGVDGRLQKIVTLKNNAAVYVDYSHTPDALATVLKQVRPYCAGELVALFGAGGDRDRGKRKLMGEAGKALADRCFVTDDNPRNEEPSSIRAAILKGVPEAKEIADRRVAISEALASLKSNDVLVVAGKGHERGQTVGKVVHPFYDADVIREEASKLDLLGDL